MKILWFSSRTLLRLTAFVLIGALLFCFSSCEKEMILSPDAGQLEVQALSGVYFSRPIDCAPLFNKAIVSSLGEEQDSDYIEALFFDECMLRLSLTIGEDAVLRAGVSQEDLQNALTKYLEARREKLQAYFVALARQKGLYLTVDEVLQQTAGCDFETYLQTLSEKFQWERVLSDSTVSYAMTAQDGTLTLFDPKDNTSPVGSFSYEKTNSTLTLLSFDGGENFPLSFSSDDASYEATLQRLLSLPLTFYRAG